MKRKEDYYGKDFEETEAITVGEKVTLVIGIAIMLLLCYYLKP